MNPSEEPTKPNEAGVASSDSPVNVNPSFEASEQTQFQPVGAAPLAPPPAGGAPFAAGAPTPPVAPQPKKSKVGLIVSLVVAGFFLLVLVPLIVVIAIPALQTGQQKLAAREVGANFFTAAKNNDAELLKSLSAPGDRSESDTVFMTSMLKKVGTNCTMNDDVTFTTKDGDKHANTTGVCDDGKQKWTIDVYMVDNAWYIYKVVLSGDAAVKTDDTKDTAPDTSTPTATACVTPAQAKELTGRDVLKGYTGAGYITSASFFFEADSAVFYPDYVAMQNADLDTYAAWIKKYADKKFVVELTPHVQEGSLSAGGSQIASQRAEYIKTQLMNRGVLASKISILPAQAESASNSDLETSRRSVLVQFTGDASCQ